MFISPEDSFNPLFKAVLHSVLWVTKIVCPGSGGVGRELEWGRVRRVGGWGWGAGEMDVTVSLSAISSGSVSHTALLHL